MRTAIAITIFIALLIMSLGNPFFAVAEEKGDVVIDEQKLKAMLEEFIDEHTDHPIYQFESYGFDMTKSFLGMDLRERKEYKYWSLGPWTVYVDNYGKGDFLVNQSVPYGPLIASLTLTVIEHRDRYEVVDRALLELELAK